MNNLIAYFVKKGVFSNLIIVFLLVLGLSSLFLIRKEVFPNVAYDIITVNTIFPGASAEESERLVTNVIERELRELDGIRDINSISRENQSFIVIQLDPDEISGDKARQDTQNIIDRIDNLPIDAEAPIVTELDSRIQPIIILSVSSDGKLNDIELREVARELEREIEFLPGVARVQAQGKRELEIRVEAQLDKLYRYRISLEELAESLRRQNLSVPGGSLDTTGQDYANMERIVRTVGEFKSLEDINKTVVRSNELGEPIFISDVADVYYQLERPRELFRTDGRGSINLTVMKKEKADAVDMVDRVREFVDEVSGSYREGVFLSFIDDSSEFIRRRLGVLSNNLVVGLGFIIIVLSLILPWRVAVVTAVCIPVSFLGTLLYFHMAGISLNLLSMLGLIIVAGMLVDGAIVVTDNTVRKMEDGLDPEEASIVGTQQVWAPITASLLTTIIAFLPMMFMSGIFGRFVFHIPVGVIVALILSMVVCFFILPYQIKRWYGPTALKRRDVPKKPSVFDGLWNNHVVPFYEWLLKKVLSFRYLVLLATLVLFAGSVYFAQSKMRFILFPPGMVEVFLIRTEAPVGTSLEKHQKLLAPLEKAVSELSDKELRNFTTHIGRIESGPGDPQSRQGSQYAQIRVLLTPDTERERDALEIIEEFRSRFSHVDGLVNITFDQVSAGPPVGAPVSVGVRGEDYEKILEVVKRVQEYLETVEGVTDITNNYILGKEEFRVIVDPAEAAAANLNVSSIGNTVRGAYEGIIATSLRTFDEEIDVRVSLDRSARTSEKTLNQIFVPNPRGDLIPLSRVAHIESSQGIDVYEHDNYRREVRVTADVLTDIVTSRDVMGEVARIQDELIGDTEGVSLNLAGEARDTDESLTSLLQAFVVALMGISFILIILFGQLMQPFLILLTIPLGIIAAIWTFFLHGQPLSFMGMLGIIALGGVIVNNSIVFVDFVNQSRREGRDRWQSILEAGKIRIRPIFLTTVTTVCGLLPTAYGIGGLDLFIVPIALVLAWGIFAGSIMMSVVIPAALAIVDDIQSLGARFSS